MDVKMIPLMLLCVFASVHSEIHKLHYIYTALSSPVKLPGVHKFTAMGILNNRLIDYYDSHDQVKMPMQDWMEKNNNEDYWVKGTQSRKSKEQWFNVNVNILIDRMGHNKSDVHVLQWMHGCHGEKTTGGKMEFTDGFDQYGYDGENFLSFDNQEAMWVAPVNQAQSTKKKWDDTPILSQYTKGYLETDCVNWLEKFVTYQDKQLQALSPPKVYIFAKKASQPDRRILVCLASEFYPPDVTVDILRNGVPLLDTDGVVSSGFRPNGERVETYQLRKTLEIKVSDTSKYSCRVHHRTLQGPIQKFWDGSCDGCDGNMAPIAAGIVSLVLIVLLVVLGVLFMLYKKKKALRMQEVALNEQKEQKEPLQTVNLIAERSDKETSQDSLDSGRGSHETVSAPLMKSGANTDSSSCSSSASGGEMKQSEPGANNVV